MSSGNEPLIRKDLPGPNYKWYVVGMLWFICFFNYADRMAVNAVASTLETQYGFTKAEIGWIISAFMYVYALSAPFAGQVGDKYHRKTLILGGLFVWSLVTGATAFCRKVWHFIAVRATEGLGETFYFPATMSLVSDYHSKKTRSRAMGFHQTSVYAGTIGGTTLAGFLAQRFGWQSPFWVFGICGIVLAVVLMVFLREPARNEAERMELQPGEKLPADPPATPIWQFLGELTKTPTALLLLVAFCGANSVAMPFMSWMPYYLSTHFKMDPVVAAFTATFYQQFGSAIGAVLGGLLADRWRHKHAGGRILTQCLGALLGIPLVYLCGAATEVSVLVVLLSMLGVAKGLYDANIWASMYDVVHPSRRATMLGLGNMVGWGGGAIVTTAVGLLTTDGKMEMGPALGATSGIYVIVSALLLIAALVYARRDIGRAGEVAPDLEPIP